ncbi:MAG TPA: ComEC/Rec2 family competence protein, partial [Propionibacterium sp.]|nr:ComEC/Rec2 family competence protein [Propionibacterium sp.]
VTSGVRTPEAADARVAAVLAGVHREVAGPGSAWVVGGARVEVLAAPALGRDLPGGEGESSAENDASLLLRVEVDGISVLLAGDAEEAAQTSHLTLGGALDTHVLLVPHHGSGRHAPAFIAAARPQVALVSVGEGNDYGHPAARTMASVADTGAAVFRTDHHGAIAVARGPDGGLLVSTQR